jgi:tetratricopeptide (TPR) repeat protein
MKTLSTGSANLQILQFFLAAGLAYSMQNLTPQSITELIQSGRFSEAREAIQASLKTRPADPELWNLMGVVDAQDNRREDGEKDFRKAVTLAPKYLPAWLNLGRLYQAGGEIEKAIPAYQTALRIDDSNAEAHHQLALLLQSKGDFRASLAHLDRLPAEDRKRKSAIALRCAGEAGIGNTETAIATADRLLNVPNVEEEDALAILPVLQAHDKAVALHLLEGLDRKHLAAHSLPQLAAAYEDAGDLKLARETFERAAQAGGASALLLDLARVAWKQKDYEGTLGYLAHARDLEPNNAGIHFFFGLACNELSLPVEAKKSMEKALELAPENPYYNYAMGAIELQWADKTQAIPYLKKFVELRPDDIRGRLALATAYFESFQQDEAKAALAVPLKNPTTRAGAEYLMGRILVQQGDLDGAISAFQRLARLQPESADAHAELAAALLEKEEAEASRREVEAALKLDPANYLANSTRLKLYQLAGDPRAKEQTVLLKKLIQNRDERLKLLQRTIEVRPW